eukprot:jgi/Chrzof1/8800/Cz03g25020.t1
MAHHVLAAMRQRFLEAFWQQVPSATNDVAGPADVQQHATLSPHAPTPLACGDHQGSAAPHGLQFDASGLYLTRVAVPSPVECTPEKEQPTTDDLQHMHHLAPAGGGLVEEFDTRYSGEFEIGKQQPQHQAPAATLPPEAPGLPHVQEVPDNIDQERPLHRHAHMSNSDDLQRQDSQADLTQINKLAGFQLPAGVLDSPPKADAHTDAVITVGVVLPGSLVKQLWAAGNSLRVIVSAADSPVPVLDSTSPVQAPVTTAAQASLASPSRSNQQSICSDEADPRGHLLLQLPTNKLPTPFGLLFVTVYTMCPAPAHQQGNHLDTSSSPLGMAATPQTCIPSTSNQQCSPQVYTGYHQQLLAQLPLLVLPQAACSEVSMLFWSMSSAAGGHEAAFMPHFVPLAVDLATVLMPQLCLGRIPSAALSQMAVGLLMWLSDQQLVQCTQLLVRAAGQCHVLFKSPTGESLTASEACDRITDKLPISIQFLQPNHSSPSAPYGFVGLPSPGIYDNSWLQHEPVMGFHGSVIRDEPMYGTAQHGWLGQLQCSDMPAHQHLWHTTQSGDLLQGGVPMHNHQLVREVFQGPWQHPPGQQWMLSAAAKQHLQPQQHGSGLLGFQNTVLPSMQPQTSANMPCQPQHAWQQQHWAHHRTHLAQQQYWTERQVHTYPVGAGQQQQQQQQQQHPPHIAYQPNPAIPFMPSVRPSSSRMPSELFRVGHASYQPVAAMGMPATGLVPDFASESFMRASAVQPNSSQQGLRHVVCARQSSTFSGYTSNVSSVQHISDSSGFSVSTSACYQVQDSLQTLPPHHNSTNSTPPSRCGSHTSHAGRA